MDATGEARSLIEALRHSWMRHPDNCAVVGDEGGLTYAELAGRSALIAHHLTTGYGIRPGDRVAVFMTRSVEMICTLVALVRVGAIMVPLDPGEPPSRLANKLADSGACLVAASPDLETPWRGQVPVAQLPGVGGTAPQAWKDAPADPADVTALMYTSGSTGTPKAVMVEQRNIVNLVTDSNFVTLTDRDRVLHLAPLAFDASTFEIWGALVNGACVVVAPPAPPDAEELEALLRDFEVSVVWLTAALFHRQIDWDPASLRGPRTVLSGGDVLSVPHLRRLLAEIPQCEVVNGYGPTETTTFATTHAICVDDLVSGSVPIGRPIQNVSIRVVLDDGAAASPGEIGELWVGGAGVTRGYWNQPGLTAQSFVTDNEGARFYRTGDLASLDSSGVVRFHGRRDGQIKLRGFRVELTEVEAALNESSLVHDAATGVRDNHRGEKTLVAWVRPGGTGLDRAALMAELRAALPSYMVPGVVMPVDRWPLTSSGKLDRRSLPEPAWTDRATYV